MDEVTVRLLRVEAEPAPEWAGLLDAGERARAAAFARPADRRRFEVAHGALRRLVADRLGVPPAGLRWRTGRHGKPEVTGAHTSLAYSGDYCLLAVGPRAVGVDLQRVEPAVLAARQFFDPAEAGCSDPARVTRLWVRKEALVKAAGGRLMEGLAVPVPTGVLVRYPSGGSFRLADAPAPDGYLAAVALDGVEPFAIAGTG